MNAMIPGGGTDPFGGTGAIDSGTLAGDGAQHAGEQKDEEGKKEDEGKNEEDQSKEEKHKKRGQQQGQQKQANKQTQDANNNRAQQAKADDSTAQTRKFGDLEFKQNPDGSLTPNNQHTADYVSQNRVNAINGQKISQGNPQSPANSGQPPSSGAQSGSGQPSGTGDSGAGQANSGQPPASSQPTGGDSGAGQANSSQPSSGDTAPPDGVSQGQMADQMTNNPPNQSGQPPTTEQVHQQFEQAQARSAEIRRENWQARVDEFNNNLNPLNEPVQDPGPFQPQKNYSAQTVESIQKQLNANPQAVHAEGAMTPAEYVSKGYAAKDIADGVLPNSITTPEAASLYYTSGLIQLSPKLQTGASAMSATQSMQSAASSAGGVIKGWLGF